MQHGSGIPDPRIGCASARCKKSNTQIITIPDEHALALHQENPNVEALHPARGPPSSISCLSGSELELRQLMKLETMTDVTWKLLCGRTKQKQNNKVVLLHNDASQGPGPD